MAIIGTGAEGTAKADSEVTIDIGTTAKTDSKIRTEEEEGTLVEKGERATGVDRDQMIEVGKTPVVKTGEDRTKETGEETMLGETMKGLEAGRTTNEEVKRKEEKTRTEQLNQMTTKAMLSLIANLKNYARFLRNNIGGKRPKRRKTRTRPCSGPNRSWRTQGP